MMDEWVVTALSDDSVVVELLFRLKQTSCEPAKPPSLSLPLGWGHRQPRSKPPISAKDSATTTSTTRCSPTTPLSWSGGAASPSDGSYDDCSNCSRPSFDPSRSKGAFTNEASNTTASCKRSGKKKTFAELKEEENFLLKERVNLTKELASLHVTLKEQRAWRENLKRIKFDLNLQSSDESMIVGSNQSNQMEASTSADLAASPLEELPRNATNEGYGSSSSSGVEKEVENPQQRCFILPDLNMMPSEEEATAPEILCGIS